uniref:aurora kinase A- and ninein-interacting protein-like isoform X2 n=1 Tax=Pristiophorus japonicus TaxID=55135 RepID=UPI00398F7BFA
MKHKKKLANHKVEECGIWLDTAVLKRRKMEPRPISKLLNPLSRSKYSVEVALNFTQTRVPQPCVIQTTVPSFFFPQSKGKPANLPQKSTPGAVDAASLVSGNNVTEGETHNDQPGLIGDKDSRVDGFGRGRLAGRGERSAATRGAAGCSQEERGPPAGTRRADTTPALNDQRHRASEHGRRFRGESRAGDGTVAREPPPTGSTSPHTPPDRLPQLDFTQDSQRNRVMSHRKSPSSPALNRSPDQGTPGAGTKAGKSEILCTERFGAGLDRHFASTLRATNGERGSTERKVMRSPRKLNSDWGGGLFAEDKENVFWPIRKEMNLNPTAWKCFLLPAGTSSLPRRSNAPRHAESPAFKRSTKPRDEQSTLSLLFSQDSQGNRVISHRRTDTSCPQNRRLAPSRCTSAIDGGSGCSLPPNAKLPLLCASSSLLQSKYDNTFSPRADLLFTQDSEGNAVIKHA